MATGDLTLTNHGGYNVSGAALKTMVDSINLNSARASGSQLFIVPIEYGQVQVLSTAVEGW